MHTLNYGDHGFHFNSDLSGNLTITKPIKIDDGKFNTTEIVSLPLIEVIEFVAELMRRNKIAEIEQMEAHEILGVNSI